MVVSRCSGLNGAPSSKHISTFSPPGPVGVILFGKRVLSDILKEIKMRVLYITYVGSCGKCPFKKHRGETQSEKERPCEDKGRDWSDVATSQERSGASGSRKRQETPSLS